MNQSLRTTALTIAAACIVVCLPLRGVAQDSKIAVVDTRTLTLMSDEGKIAGDKLQKRLDAIRTEMDKLRKDIEDKDNKLRTSDRLLSSAAKASLAKEIDDDKFKFDQKAQVYEKEMNEMQNTLLGPVQEKVRLELEAYVKQPDKGYTVVIDLSAENPNVVWFNVNNDITKDVMVRLNENFKRGGGAAAPAPAAAPTPRPATPSAPATTIPRAPAGTTTPPAGQRPPAATPATPPAEQKE